MRCAPGLSVSGKRSVRAAILIAACGSAVPAIAQDRSWLGGNGLWNNGANWSPIGVPSWGDNIYIGNVPGVSNSTVQVDTGAFTIGGGDFFISNGMTLDLNGVELATFGDVSLSGAGTTLIARPGPPGINEADFQAETFIGAGSHFQLIDNPLVKFYDDSFNSGILSGRGTIRLESWAPFRNEGVIAPSGNGGLVMRTTVPGQSVDLDGTSGNGSLQLTTPFSQLTLEADALSDSFSGDILMGTGSYLDMNIQNGWTTDGSSTINVASSIAGAAAQIGGSQLTLGGALNIGGSHGALRVLADASVAGSADVFLGNDDRLEFDGSTIVQGGNFTISQGARVDFDGPTEVNGGTFNTADPAIADGSINFNGATEWNGQATFNGVAIQNYAAEVTGPTVINAQKFDVDGEAELASWAVRDSLVINADQIDSSVISPNHFNGAMIVSDGISARLTVNLTDPSARWTMDGYMSLEGIGALPVTRVAGSPMDVSALLIVSGGLVQITADTSLLATSDIAINAGSTLRLRGNSVVSAGADFLGLGLLQNGVGGKMLIESGASLDFTGLVNSGVLRIGESGPGVASADRFSNTSSGTWAVDIGGYLAGVEHDSFIITAGTASLDGMLVVSIAGMDGASFAPNVGDEFKILSAIGGVTGTFVNDPVSQVGSLTYDWSVIYNSNSVILRLDSIVPAPGTAALLAIGTLVAARRRRA